MSVCVRFMPLSQQNNDCVPGAPFSSAVCFESGSATAQLWCEWSNTGHSRNCRIEHYMWESVATEPQEKSCGFTKSRC